VTRSIDMLIAFMDRHMTRAEMRGFVKGISRSRGCEVSIPDDYRARRAAEDYLRRSLDEPTAASYVRVLDQRLRAGAALVSRALLPKRVRPTVAPPRNADEFEQRQREAQSRGFWHKHEKNRQSPRYAQLRKKRLSVAGHRCEDCGSTTRLQLHHLHYETLRAEKVGDVRILCERCHAEATDRQRAVRRARWRGGPSTRGPKLHG